MVSVSEKNYPDNQIWVFDDVISDKLCKKIRRMLTEDNPDIVNLTYGRGQNVKCIAIEPPPPKLDKKIQDVVYDIIQKLPKCISIFHDCGYMLRRISGPTLFHVDGLINDLSDQDRDLTRVSTLRKLTLIIALNDDYEGGEFCFPEQNFKIKLKKGQAIAFPPYWTHPHYTNKLYKNTFRYTINTWLW